MLHRAFTEPLDFKNFLWGGGTCPQTPLAARAFGARYFPRLALKSGYGPAKINLGILLFACLSRFNLVPRGPFCHALEISGPLARPNDIPVLNGCVNTID